MSDNNITWTKWRKSLRHILVKGKSRCGKTPPADVTFTKVTTAAMPPDSGWCWMCWSSWCREHRKPIKPLPASFERHRTAVTVEDD